MAVINLPKDQMDAIGAIEPKQLNRLIERAIETEDSGALGSCLRACGSYISDQLRSFERALKTHREARSATKRDRTGRELRQAAYDLSYAVAAMQQRVDEERKDGELFYIEDRVLAPFRYSRRLSVTLGFRWRRNTSEVWQHGQITFTHAYEPPRDPSIFTRKPKLSAAKQEQELQKQLSHAWNDLMKHGLWSLREYFKQDGDGAKIPKFFTAIPDSYSRTLNNFSTDFWRDRPM